MAGLAVGAITDGIYTTCSVNEVRHQLENAEARIFIAENQEYVDKILELQNLSTDLRHIIVADLRAMFLYDDERILSLRRCRTWAVNFARGSPSYSSVASTRLNPMT